MDCTLLVEGLSHLNKIEAVEKVETCRTSVMIPCNGKDWS